MYRPTYSSEHIKYIIAPHGLCPCNIGIHHYPCKIRLCMQWWIVLLFSTYSQFMTFCGNFILGNRRLTAKSRYWIIITVMISKSPNHWSYIRQIKWQRSKYRGIFKRITLEFTWIFVFLCTPSIHTLWNCCVI